jgi:sortase (surface protein transpeptidase)
MAARSPTARLAGVAVALTLVLGPVLSGCSTPARGATAARPAASTPTAAAADSFRSPRTHRTVAVPVRIRIPAAGVNSVLDRLGRAADGTIALPSRPERAGWYAEGPRPGQPGPAVIIGHVDWDHGPAVFFHLDELRPGDRVYVDRADGSTGRFRVTGTFRVPKVRFPTDLVYAPTLEVSLRLVTCGGSFDRATRNYRDNVIVFAAPA